MKYIKTELEDKTPIKFKLETVNEGLKINWKYDNMFNFSKAIIVHMTKEEAEKEIDYVIKDEKYVKLFLRVYKTFIEEEHKKILNKLYKNIKK